MIFAATDWLNVSINLLLILFVIICLVMMLMILMQRPKQEGLGAAFGGGMTDQMFGARTTNVLQRGTVWFASLFFILALTLAVLIGMKNSRTESLISKGAPEEATEVTESTAGPDAEAIETIRSLIENSEASSEQAPLEVAPAEEPAPDAPATEEETVEETPAPEEDSADR
jgi:preprotein translocase subunit SecG